MTLRMRIIFAYVFLMAGSFLCFIYLIMVDVRPRYLEAVEETTVDMAEFLAALLSQQSTEGTVRMDGIDAAMTALADRKLSAQIYNFHKQRVTLRVYITDAKGILLYDSTRETPQGTDFSNWRDIHLTLKGMYGARSTPTGTGDPVSRVLFIAAPILRDGHLLGVVSVGKPTDSISLFIAIARERFLSGLALIGLSAIALSIILSTWLTRPLKRLIEYMQSIRQGKKAHLPPLGASEMSALGAALEEMQVKLEGKNYIEDYVRALTHEMKSPLTGIKGAGEILRDHVTDPRGCKFLDNIDTEVVRLQSLVERMLQLSRLENVRTVTKAPVRLIPLLQGLKDTFHARLEEKKLLLAVDAGEQLFMVGDELLLRQALGNIIANAIDFSPFDSRIEISAATCEKYLNITIRDYGTGIPDFAAAKIFEKFFSLNRPDTGKKSSGLGLPFVKEVVSLHEGEITAGNANPGFQVCLSLPL